MSAPPTVEVLKAGYDERLERHTGPCSNGLPCAVCRTVITTGEHWVLSKSSRPRHAYSFCSTRCLTVYTL